MTVGPPRTAAEWDTRPVFCWDRNVTWRGFCDELRSDEAWVRRTALARLLNEATWEVVWALTDVDTVRRELDFLLLREPGFWRTFLAAV